MSEVVKLTIVSDSVEHQPEQTSKNLTVGEKLAFARSQQELTVEQVAAQLKWSVRQIVAIEAGNYSIFPDMLTVRGFVRTYAKILKIDLTSLLQDLATDYENFPIKPLDRPKLDTPFSTGRMPLLGRHHDNNSQKILGTAILIFLCLFAVFVWRVELLRFVGVTYPLSSDQVTGPLGNARSDRNLQTEFKQDVQQNVNSLPILEEKIQQAPESNGENAQSLSSVLTSESHPNVSASMLLAVNPKLDEVKSGVTQFEQEKNSHPAEFSSADTLLLSFKHDSWIQIKRLNGTIVISRLYKAGTEEMVNVNEPMNIVIGNALGVEVKLRGQNLVLPPQVGSNVVNLSIK